MRILYLTDRLSDRGGADHHLAQVVADAVASGHRPMIAYGRRGPALRALDGVESMGIRGLESRVDTSSGLEGLSEELDRADVIHLQNIMNPTVVRMAVDRRRTVITIQDHRFFCPGPGKTMPDGTACTVRMDPTVCSACVPDDRYLRSIHDLTRDRLRALDGARLVVLSRYMKDELGREGFPDAAVIPPWVEIGPVRQAAGSTVTMGGRLVAHKGVLDGWRAWNEAGRPLPLVVAGAGRLADRLLGAALLGWLEQEALRATLRESRMLLFPARWQEPFGILGVEALAQGTPVVVADRGGTSEWSSRGCLRVPAGNVPAMTEAIRSLAGSPDRAATLGREGRSAVRELFARETIVRRLLELYEEVAA